MGDAMDEHDTAPHDPSAGTSPIELVLEVSVSRARAWDAYVHGLSEWWLPGWTASGSGLELIELGRRDEVLAAAARDTASVVPVLRDGIFTAL